MPQTDPRYHSSPFNFLEEVTSEERFKLPIVLQDVTLREGEQAAEIAFSVQDKVEVAQRLDSLGIPLIQVGYGGGDEEALTAIKRAGVKAELSLLGPAFKSDWQDAIDRAVDAGVDNYFVLMRTSDTVLKTLGMTREDAIERACQAITYARRRGAPTVTFEPSFVTAADPKFLKQIYHAAYEAGAQAAGICDSMGVAKPSAIRHLVRLASDAVPVPIGIHAHHDFGLSVALTLAALEEGAQRADVTILGLGERAGGTPLEELVIALKGLYGIDTGVDTEQLADLIQLVHDLTKVPIPASKPVVGENVFAQKLEVHVKFTSHAPELLEPYDPGLVGNRRLLKLGRGTGPSGIKAKLAELGLQAPEEKVPLLVETVNTRAIEHKKSISDTEFAEMVQSVSTAGTDQLKSRPLNLWEQCRTDLMGELRALIFQKQVDFYSRHRHEVTPPPCPCA